MPTFAFPNDGALAERLGTGLQNLLQRFDSARHLQKMPLNLFQGHLLYKIDTELILKSLSMLTYLGSGGKPAIL